MGRLLCLLVVVAVTLMIPAAAQAGMPSVNLTDAGQMRLSTLSFFLMGFLLSAWAVKGAWNLLQRDFPRLPRLTYKLACGVVFLWGLLFVLVLTMISGARELMTPGAWEKKGFTYQLTEKEKESPPDATPSETDLQTERFAQIERLRTALLLYAVRHGGHFPTVDDAGAIDDEVWQVPRRAGMRYHYKPGASALTPHAVVAYEPAVYEDRQLVLRADGYVERMSAEQLSNALRGEESP